MLNLSKLVPALAAGNTVVLKAAPDTPWSATFIGKLAAEFTDMPAGVFNVITSADPAAAGEALTTDPRVDMISFTGSTAVGKRIMANGADTLKKVFLELGGKSANIVLDDADFDAIMPSGAMVCMHSGQGCAITTRMLVPRSRATTKRSTCSFRRSRRSRTAIPTATLEHDGTAHQRAGSASACSATSRRARRRAPSCWWVGSARRSSRRDSSSSRRSSSTSTPTPRSPQEEIFGPVLAVIPYDDDDDAVRIANNSKYGLSGAVNGAPTSIGRSRIARRIRAGTVAVNGGSTSVPTRPSAATSSRASVASTGCRASRSTSRRRPSASPRPPVLMARL